MLKDGQIVKIGNEDYKVVTLKDKELPCINCAIKRCHMNREFDEFKAKHGALSCVDLIPVHSRFEKINVEQTPQVVYKCKTIEVTVMTATNDNKLDPGFWVGLILIGILIYCTTKCS